LIDVRQAAAFLPHEQMSGALGLATGKTSELLCPHLAGPTLWTGFPYNGCSQLANRTQLLLAIMLFSLWRRPREACAITGQLTASRYRISRCGALYTSYWPTSILTFALEPLMSNISPGDGTSRSNRNHLLPFSDS